ncbi:MAG: hypothetical protein ACRDTF_03060 [Pseudonocardiaceae bacterium]
MTTDEALDALLGHTRASDLIAAAREAMTAANGTPSTATPSSPPWSRQACRIETSSRRPNYPAPPSNAG